MILLPRTFVNLWLNPEHFTPKFSATEEISSRLCWRRRNVMTWAKNVSPLLVKVKQKTGTLWRPSCIHNTLTCLFRFVYFFVFYVCYVLIGFG